ncbi:MAG TPA: electron transfer flavoprotein subunit alpha/FixB family protein [Smithella sp.]|nr:electron transfer flavoprotein subunit alpha/FixB family protein [Smithella sp.]HQO14537.1 electron transfer flavoprotein subunit alpha/FixB family protein [Smithellaceae bacterium]MDM7985780.1 electron transfer flavoprotein subunit alpha/FixB family protein [Smithella sp.]HNY49948.1 electron transfer flavoprotein subunit alpha/FixB family protein [Smithella sp.]HOG90476.1 electron transfer flavoprotein subunit alpha/FixB family protein [Smithella sp.]
MTKNRKKSIWVFGDYRNYYQNRVTLQLIARAVALAKTIDAEVCALIFGYEIDEWIMEYTAHGADRILAIDDPALKSYSTERYLAIIEKLAKERDPEIILIGATDFGREFAPRLAKRLKTGLSADCVGLEITEDGLLLQIAPSFGGNMLAEIVTEFHRPQMATVRPGTFKEIPHDYERTAIVERLPLMKGLPKPRVRLIEYERSIEKEHTIENASVIVCGGRGMGNKEKFKKLQELAKLLGGDVGATRPVVYAGWADHNVLVGQAGKHIKPKILFSFGISGAIQHTAGLGEADFIVAINKNPQATMLKMADVAVVGDASDVLNHLIKELRKRIRE